MEDDDEEVQEVDASGKNPASKKKPRENWRQEQEVALAKARIQVSECKKFGNDQKNEGFWKRILEHYTSTLGSTSRTFHGLNTKWKTMNWAMGLFNGLYQQAVRAKASGCNDLDVMKVALADYQTKTKKRFGHVASWDVVKGHDKWLEQDCFQQVGGSSNSSKRKSGEYESASNENIIPDMNEDPIPSWDSRKSKKKQGASSTSISSAAEDISSYAKSKQQYLDEKRIGNQISGEIPYDIGKLTRLTVLNFADNKLMGRIPRSLAYLSSLKHLDLRNNMISGTIQRNFGKLRMLSRALPSNNKIYGPIPKSISYIYRLSDLDLSLNRFTGPIPGLIGKMSVLGTLNLDGNQLSGTIPSSLMTSRISILNLSRNAIEGNIQDVFGPRSYFMLIDLSYNKLKGSIPKSISLASYIGHIDLSHNHLCGKIPVVTFFDHIEASSFMYNDCLCGKPLKACS